MMWIWDSESKRMVNREIKYVPGFFKIVDEILVNAADNKVSFCPSSYGALWLSKPHCIGFVWEHVGNGL